MRKVEIAHDLSGRPVRIVTQLMREGRMPTNVGTSKLEVLMEVDEGEEQKAYSLLPKPVQEWLRERCPFDQAAPPVLEQWDSAKVKGYTVERFLWYLDHVALKYINETKGVWPTSPPDLKQLPRWERYR